MEKAKEDAASQQQQQQPQQQLLVSNNGPQSGNNASILQSNNGNTCLGPPKTMPDPFSVNLDANVLPFGSALQPQVNFNA